jgi:MoaA/NifB/PqqE/SkfB family radical SAM enzyme
VHCYAESSPERSEALELSVIEAILDDAAALGFPRIQFTGGDPRVSPHLAAAVAYAAQRGLQAIEIYTNGLALSERLIEQLRPYGVVFAFSFYSADAAVHDAITRTPGSQRRTLAAIERVLRAGLTARASVIVMETNHGQVDATRALLRSLGLPESAIGLDVQRSVGRGLMTLRPREAGLPTGVSAGHRAAADESGPRFEGRAAVAYDGTVYPCIFSRAFPLGDVRSRPLREILREPVPLGYEDARLWAEVARKEAQLACWECRLRGALLALQASPVRPG